MRVKSGVFCGLLLAAAIVLSIGARPASAAVSSYAGDDSLRDSIVKAVTTHPEVQAKWHALRAAEHEVEAAKGGYRPKLDVTAGWGRENLDGKGYSGSELFNYTRTGVAAFLTQMIYDGNLTNSSVKRYGHAMRARYFDLIATMEQSALAAIHVRADLARYNHLTRLARENLKRHEELMAKVEERTSGGLDSAVNLETAKGRLALARVNLVTEESNLHDTITQYIRIVGEDPRVELFDADVHIDLHVPSNSDIGVDEALRYNPLLISYAQNSQTMRYIVEEQRSNFRPRVELRAGTAQDTNASGTDGWREKSYVELAMTYNLYNGGRDEANLKRASEEHKQAFETFRKLERDITQSVLVSYNDIAAYEAQLPSLLQHSESANATRQAYIRQFEAGRRSLLDLLDSENEYYQAELAYVNADYNQRTAKADYLASTGKLLEHYGIVREDVPTPDRVKYTFDEVTEDVAVKGLKGKK